MSFIEELIPKKDFTTSNTLPIIKIALSQVFMQQL